MKRSATVYTDSGSVALAINSVRREGDRLVVDGKALGEMRMDMIFTAGEIFNALRIALCWGVVTFVLVFKRSFHTGNMWLPAPKAASEPRRMASTFMAGKAHR